MTTTTDTISREEFDYMLENPHARLLCMDDLPGRCAVHYDGEGRQFVMTGPTGVHCLYAPATSLDRLNAHWTVFVGVGR